MRMTKRNDWRTVPMPEPSATVQLDSRFTLAEFERLTEGLLPREMSDKWFGFYEEPWLYLHRSWIGYCIYQVRFERHVGHMLATEARVNRNPDQNVDSLEHSALLLNQLLDACAGRDVGPVSESWAPTVSGRWPAVPRRRQ